jgi:hypothetical protein
VKRDIFIALILLLPFKAFSQTYEYIPFPDSGAIWSEVYYHPDPTWPDTVIKPPSFERFALNGEDTIYNSISYKKLYIFYDSAFSKSKATYIGGIREDENKRIYFKGDTIVHDLKPSYHNTDDPSSEVLLYDFSLTIGDTLKNSNLSVWGEFLIVSTIDTIQIKDTYRKQYSFEPIWWVHWIEGIGNVKGLLFTSGDLPFNGTNGNLICFKQNDEILYYNDAYSECFPVLTGIETKKNDFSDYILYPNPSTDNIRICFGEHQMKSFQVIDCNGRLCGDYDIQFQTEFFLSTEKYQPGIYFYKATNMNGMVHTGKFVVQ